MSVWEPEAGLFGDSYPWFSKLVIPDENKSVIEKSRLVRHSLRGQTGERGGPGQVEELVDKLID
jgi:hypothetical protein